MMEEIAPPYLAEEWDNVGFQIGDINQLIDKAMICLEVTDAVIDEAIAKGVGLIISHHPLIFRPIRNIRMQDPTGKMIFRLIQHRIGLYCAHTNLDSVLGGVNDVLATILEIKDTIPLNNTRFEKYFKLIVFVPHSHVEGVRDAMCRAGGGHIGNYSHCTFQTEGIGTFKPLEGTNPFIGKQGVIEKTPEVRMEIIVPKEKLDAVVQEMIQAHPYEEVAYDVIPLDNAVNRHGLGRVGKFKKPLSLFQLCQKLKEKLGTASIKFVGDPDKQVQKVGLCGGSGGEFIQEALNCGCDCYITGDIKYHDAQYALHTGIALIDAGHLETEQIICADLARRLEEAVQAHRYDLQILLSQTNINPFQVL